MSLQNLTNTSKHLRDDELEVDFETSVTDLYKAITCSDWDAATKALGLAPKEARTWVVRYHEDTKDVMWRFLPLHSACARNPPPAFASALIEAYPEAAQTADNQGMYPLHYACGNQASRQVIRSLLVAFPKATKLADPKGMLPIHHLACWGPSKLSVIDMILFANRDVAECKDEDGNTPMDLVKDADYEERNDVIKAMERWLKRKDYKKEPSSAMSVSSPVKFPGSTGSVFAETDDNSVFTASERLERTAIELKEKLEETEQTLRQLKSLCFDSDIKTRVAVGELQKMQEVLGERDEELKERGDTIAAQEESYEILQMEMEENESTLKEERENLNGLLNEVAQKTKTSADEATEKIKFLEGLIREKELELEEKGNIISEKSQKNTELTQQLDDKKKQFETLRNEKDDVERAIKELVEDTIKTKIDIKDSRFDSLSESHAIMVKKQAEAEKAIQERQMKSAESRELRRERLLELLEAEEHQAANDADIEDMSVSLEKQARELDAIAAILSEIRN